MTAEIKPSALCGTVKAPPSKSAAHRALICAALSDRPVTVYNCGNSNDISATVSAITALGAHVSRKGNDLTVIPVLKSVSDVVIDCGESGSTARFMIPVAAALGAKNAVFTGSGRLPERPFEVLTASLRENGIACSSDQLPMTVSGRLKSGNFRMPGNISSQYISGLLFALSVVPGESRIILTSPLESAAYVDMTVNELNLFGADIKRTESGYTVYGKERLSGCDRTVEGDWSQAAFFLCAGAVNGDITVTGLDADSLQGDREIVRLLKEFGAEVYVSGSSVRTVKSNLHGISIDASQIPDLVPILAVTAALAKGTTVIHHAERLRLKESDRLKETVLRLRAFGISANETSDGMTVTGGKPVNSKTDSGNDHRLAMAFSVLASACGGASKICGSEAVNKSYPDFFEDFNSIGGICNVI